MTKQWGWALGLCGLVVAIDQASKAFVESKLVPGESVHVIPGLDIVDVHNRGAAFGLFAGGQVSVVAVSIVAIVLISIYLALNASKPWLWLAAGLIAGGAVGNLVDRVRIDSVTDFIDPVLWPAFNVADMAITAGVVVLVLSVTSKA